jgi:hypothetical protein
VYAYVIHATGGYFLVQVATFSGFIVYQQRFEWYEEARAQEFCDMLNTLAAWNSGRGAA